MYDTGKMRVAVDAVVFTVKNNELEILLVKRKYDPYKGKFAIPGGFVKEDEDLMDAAQRELTEETGVGKIFLQQIGAYGKPDRDPRGRILSIAYIALIKGDRVLTAATDAEVAEWFSIKNLPELAFDHKKIVNDALEHLKFEIQTTNIAFQILPKKFTMSMLQSLYESILNKKFDKRNFRKRIKELNILKDTGETWMEGAHRPAKLHMFKDQKYSSIKDKISVLLK